MPRHLHIYYSAVLGALGGLVGWWLVGSVETGSWNIWVAYPFVGAGLGLCLGACLALTDSLISRRGWRRILTRMITGSLAGLLAGLVGLLLAEIVFLAAGGGWIGRTSGWIALGGLLGFSDLLVSHRLQRALYGALGGFVGGLVGGLLYEGLTQLFLTQSGSAQILIGGVGLTLLGAWIGAAIPLARKTLARGELRVLDGDYAGLSRELAELTTIGRDDGCDLYLPDMATSWRHAQVRRIKHGFLLEVHPDAADSVIIGERTIIPPGKSFELENGTRLRIGKTLVEFRTKREESERTKEQGIKST